MDQKIKADWLAALRSGEYKQGTMQLRIKGDEGVPDEFCCLGVLCDLAVKAEVIPEPRQYDDGYFYGPENEGDNLTLPQAVQEWAGLEDENPYVDDETLAGWNDGEGGDGSDAYPGREPKPFPEIADLIEKYL